MSVTNDMKTIVKNDNSLIFFSRDIRAKLGARVKRMILFGSRARGDAHPHSDADCLVGVDRVSSRVNESIDETAGETLCRYGIMVSAFPVSDATIKRRRFSPLLINVGKEGILL
jgi:predicted nucleotidyltransferase